VLACAPDTVAPNGFVRGDEAGPPAASVPLDASALPSPDVPPPNARPGDAGIGADPRCDLGGRWLIAQRVLATAIGQQQAAHSWFYYEVEQHGDALLVTRGLHCGFDVVAKTSLAASVNASAVWPALLVHDSSTGRRGTFTRENAGCRLVLEKEYVVRGATVSHYKDPAQKLPDRTQPASAGTPGWEDWDGDGNPGISLQVSSALAGGTLYTCQRDWTRYEGTTPAGAVKLQVPVSYGGEQVALGRSAGSAQAIESSSTPSSDPAQHYAWLHRLEPGQAEGSDAEICAAIRRLKDSLVPEANR
jgi:hypothetical protein